MTDIDMVPVHIQLGTAMPSTPTDPWPLHTVFPTPLPIKLDTGNDTGQDIGRLTSIHIDNTRHGLFHGSGVLNLRIFAARCAHQKITSRGNWPIAIQWEQQPTLHAVAILLPDQATDRAAGIWTVAADLDMASCPCRI